MYNCGTVVNIDSDFLWYIYEGNGKTVKNAKEQMKNYVDYYVGHNISDLVFCVFCQCSVTPSEKWTWFGDKLLWKEEGGVPVDYSSHPRLVPYYEYFKNGNCEPVQTLLEETRRNGMNPWLSFRMNDVHCHTDLTSFLRGKEFYELNKEGQQVYGKLVYGNNSFYYNKSFNYENPEVRSKMLSYLKEQIDRYDMYGIELDFMREITCFEYYEKPTDYYCEILNDFLRTVNKYLIERSVILGHDIKLMIRIPRDIKQSRIFGFDAKKWVEEGLVDILVPTPRWATSDSDMPISSWVKMVKGSKTEIYAGQERTYSHEFLPGVMNNLETVKGLASTYFNAGASKTYLFNYFYTYDMFKDTPKHPGYIVDLQKIWEDASSVKRTNKGIRRNVLSYQENDATPRNCLPYRPLPLSLNNWTTLTIQIGEVTMLDSITVYIVFDEHEIKDVINITAKNIVFERMSDVSGAYISKDFIKGNKMIAFKGKVVKKLSGNITFGFNTKSCPTLQYFEIKIEN